ncbi:hypothetical protein H634G_10583 [Metarhizium anisopliae BRIP 53293]|uniref:Uncharacterized protein n=1 Tax=Metarhizium anisopliae BRIP 53293 TaxID=1291518 RepID=A0A0D9NNL9_METAN|nr:hypothetical protein H634G_10583 [Metarhizium anisopliae BRIP 53293]KJK84947.1 hypothetical protein H633G_11228 [Metarhizium anisopliae BRIP 53284]
MDLFRHPELLDDAAKLIESLEYQKRVVECFQRTKKHLETQLLESNVLKKCATFIAAAESSATGSNFLLEVSKLTLDELGFCSISFDDRRLKMVQHSFKASHVRAYMMSQRVSCINHREIFRRLTFYCNGKNDKFLKIYDSAKKADEIEVSAQGETLATEFAARKKRHLGSPARSSSNSTSEQCEQHYHAPLDCGNFNTQCDRKRKYEEEKHFSAKQSTRAYVADVADRSQSESTSGIQVVLNMASLDNITDILPVYLVEGMKQSLKRMQERTSNNLTDAVNLHMPSKKHEDCVLKIWVCFEIGKQVSELKMGLVDELRDVLGDFLFNGMETSYFRQDEREAGVFEGTNAIKASPFGEDYLVELLLSFDTAVKALPILYPG